MEKEKQYIELPGDVELGDFKPTAYFDKHLDCIRVMTHDRSVTEIRLNEFVTLHECNRSHGHDECNHMSRNDPPYVGFTLKGVRSLYEAADLEIDGVYKLTVVLDKFVSMYPHSTMSATLGLIDHIYRNSGDIKVEPLDEAA